MGLICSICGSEEDGSSKQPQPVAGGGAAPLAAPRPQKAPQSGRAKQKHRETHWKSTGIVGIRDQGITHLPPSVAEVGPDAKVLDAANNRLHELPPAVAQMPNLQRIVLAHNSIFTVSGALLRHLRNLRILNLDHNSVSELPEEVCWLSKLEKLSVNFNHLSGLPAGLASCQKLSCILISHNRLKGLPAGEVLPPSLEEFKASHNNISHIPPSWGKLKKLKVLNLDENRVSDLPQEVLADCISLHTLCLHGCPIGPAQLQANPGFHAFEERRKGKYDKAISSGVMTGARQLDEGVDRQHMHHHSRHSST